MVQPRLLVTCLYICGVICLCHQAESSLFADEGWRSYSISEQQVPGSQCLFEDLNGDGFTEGVGFQQGVGDNPELVVYLRPEKPDQAWRTIPLGEVAIADGMTLADLDGDRRIEIVATYGLHTLRVFEPATDPLSIDRANTWAARNVQIANLKLPNATLLTAEIDGDAGSEIVITSQKQIGWTNSMQSETWDYYRVADVVSPESIRIADLTRDGRDDLLFCQSEGPFAGIHWLTNPGTDVVVRSEGWLHTQIGPTKDTYASLAVGDFGNDGLNDVVGATTAGVLQLFVQHRPNPPGWKPLTVPSQLDAKSGLALAVADINADGRQDIVHAASHSEDAAATSLVWFEQRISRVGPIWLVRTISPRIDGRLRQLSMMDIDRDGDLDVICTIDGPQQSRTVWFENAR